MGKALRNAKYISWIAILTALDLLTKALAEKTLMPGKPISSPGNLFVLVYAENHGAFLGMGAGFHDIVWYALFLLAPAAVVLFLLIKLLQGNEARAWVRASYLLVIAGGLGNLVDRALRHGYVRDFLNVGIGQLRSGILNVADLYVTAGVVILVVLSLASRKAS